MMALQLLLPFLLDPLRAFVRAEPAEPKAAEKPSVARDLQRIAKAVSHTYFGGKLVVNIQWSRSRKAKPRRRARSMLLGSYAREKNLVRIHPALSQPWVPDFFVEYVVFHEMLHAVVPPQRVGRKTYYHPAEFRLRERSYPFFKEALRWQRDNLGRLLTSVVR